MSGTEVKRRGDTAAVLDGLTIAEREIAVDTTNWRLRLGDGVTQGGHALAKVIDLVANAPKLQTVRVVDTTGADPASAYADGTTHDSVVVATGEVILRATAGGDPDDGFWVVPAAGAAERLAAFTAFGNFPGVLVTVQEGTLYARTIWLCVSEAGGTIDVDAIEVNLDGEAGTDAIARDLDGDGVF